MTQPPRTFLGILGAAALGVFVMVAFLLPRGELLSYTALLAALSLCTAALMGYVYAKWFAVSAPRRDEDLRPEVDVCVLAQNDRAVPETLCDGGAPLVALVREGEVLHPEFSDLLAPYFAEPSLAFVQAAVHHHGEGRVAEAFYAQETIAHSCAGGKNALNAAPLYGSGALIAREALQAAYRPGISFSELGLRLQALGYGSYFEEAPLVLAAAPQSVSEYWPLMLSRGRRAFALLWPAATVRRLPLAARLQYFAAAAGYAAVAAGGLAVTLAPLALLLRGVGPFIVSSVSLPGLVFAAGCTVLSLYAFRRSAAAPVAAPALLALAGGIAGGYAASRAAARRAAALYRYLVAIVRADESADTAPAGSPARL
jgi:hypothetical protein